jgi:hypothetical protein
MKRFFFAVSLLCTSFMVSPVKAQKFLKQVITLQMPEGDGSNSAAVVWHPITKKYYTSFAGNASYPMAVFSDKGKILQEDMLADYDFRGIWYNPISKLLQFNTYDSSGVGHIELETDGKIKSKLIDFEGMNQPDGQSVGIYYPPGNNILYLSSSHYVEKYDSKNLKPLGSLTYIYVGCKTKKEADELSEDDATARWEDRNYSIQYTNIPKGELAVLNYTDRTIELYDKKTGLLSPTFFSIPDNIEIKLNFNFSYSNGIWWFFQKEKRMWIGCK